MLGVSPIDQKAEVGAQRTDVTDQPLRLTQREALHDHSGYHRSIFVAGLSRCSDLRLVPFDWPAVSELRTDRNQS